MKLGQSFYPETPDGKRTVRENQWGNIVGYVSGRRFWEFGVVSSWNRETARLWQEGSSLEGAIHRKGDWGRRLRAALS